MENIETHLICSRCNNKITANMYKVGCVDCGVAEHRCPNTITTADIKKCRYHKILGVFDKETRERIEKRFGE